MIVLVVTNIIIVHELVIIEFNYIVISNICHMHTSLRNDEQFFFYYLKSHFKVYCFKKDCNNNKNVYLVCKSK